MEILLESLTRQDALMIVGAFFGISAMAWGVSVLAKIIWRF